MKHYSQNGEDLFILELFKGVKRQLYYVELGAGDGVHFSNCRLLKENGWKGISVDADNKGNSDVIQSFITVENILETIGDSKIDFLSIDLDGNDYWILLEILNNGDNKPKVICCEINSQLHNKYAMAINYDASRFWDGSYSYGMNYVAAFEILEHFGYQVIKNVNNTNLIAVKNVISYDDCELTYSHPEVLPEGSKFVKVHELQ
jgi:hypothetical protein